MTDNTTNKDRQCVTSSAVLQSVPVGPHAGITEAPSASHVPPFGDTPLPCAVWILPSLKKHPRSNRPLRETGTQRKILKGELKVQTKRWVWATVLARLHMVSAHACILQIFPASGMELIIVGFHCCLYFIPLLSFTFRHNSLTSSACEKGCFPSWMQHTLRFWGDCMFRGHVGPWQLSDLIWAHLSTDQRHVEML